MGFFNLMKNEYLENSNLSVTENGAIGYKSTGKNLLDINFAVSSLRSKSDEEIIDLFKKAFFEDKILAIKWIFFARDIRGGLGERRLFRVIIKFLADYDPEMVKKLIPLIPKYGRYDDIFVLLDNDEVLSDVINYIQKQFFQDIIDLQNNRPVSLMAKWLPSVNASSEKSKRYSKIIRKGLGMTEAEYRKNLSALRKYIYVVECKMSSKNWSDINYEHVPSRANLIYKNAFLRNDYQRRCEYLSKLEKGEAKINSSVLYPHDIVYKYISREYWSSNTKPYDAAIEAMWRNLPNMVNDISNGNTIVVADGSGSMIRSIDRSSDVTALEVAISLAIYFAEHSSGEFKDKYITFSENPQFVDFSKANSLKEKIDIALINKEVANTNIERVFSLILNTAIANHMDQSDIPDNILIISDMEFDECATCDHEKVSNRLFSEISNSYELFGYKLPRLIFWNINSRTNTIPIKENELGVALVSGFSINVCKMIMSGKTDPYECLIEVLNSERYNQIEDVIK